MKRRHELQNKLVAFHVTGIAKGCNRDLLNKSTGYLVLCTVTAPKMELGQLLRRGVADVTPLILLWRLRSYCEEELDLNQLCKCGRSWLWKGKDRSLCSKISFPTKNLTCPQPIRSCSLSPKDIGRDLEASEAETSS